MVYGRSIPAIVQLYSFPIKVLTGSLDTAYKTLLNYFDVWRKFGMTPEFFRVDVWSVMKSKEGYPLRPGKC